MVEKIRTLQVLAQEAGMRLDRWLTLHEPTLGRKAAKAYCEAGLVFVDGHRAQKATPLPAGATISFPVVVLKEAVANSELELDVRCDDDSYVVVHKPAGQPTAPLNALETATLANALLGRYPNLRGVGTNPLEPGLIHRLDNGTSGLLVAAKSQRAFELLKRALARGDIDKEYIAIVSDRDLPDAGRIDVPLEPSPHSVRRVIAARSRSRNARPAETHFNVVERQAGFAIVRATAKRALRHQIRAHFANIDCPLANDEPYGGQRIEELAPGRHALHARRIAWLGTVDMPGFEVVAQLPSDISAWLNLVGFTLASSI